MTGEWKKQDIGDSGRSFSDTMLPPVFPDEFIDDKIYNAMT